MSTEVTSPGDEKPASPNQAPDEQKPDAAKGPDPKANGKDQANDGEPAAAPPGGEQGDDGKSKNKVKARDRIDQLTAKNHDLRRRAEAAEANLKQLQQGLKPPPPTAPQEEHDDFRVRKAVRQERVDEASQEAQNAVSEARRAVFDTFQAKADAARESFPNLVDNFCKLPKVSSEMADFVADSDVGAEIAHHLVENPAEAERIAGLSSFEQGKALARIEASIGKPGRRASNAPPPVPNTPGSPSTGGKTPETMSMEEYAAWAQRRGKK